MTQQIKLQDGVIVYSTTDPFSVGVDFKIKGQLTLGNNNPYFPAVITTNLGHLELTPNKGDVKVKASDHTDLAFGFANQIIMNAGTAVNSGVGGNAYLVAGDGPDGAGQVTIGGGYSTVGTGGLVALIGGNNESPTNPAGIIQLIAGTNTLDSTLSGGLQVITNGVERFLIGPAGEYRFNLSYGTPGQMLTSAGPGLPTVWTTPTGELSAPINEIVFGTGAGVSSSTDLTFDDTTDTLTIGSAMPGLVSADTGQSLTLASDVSVTVSVNSVDRLSVDATGTFYLSGSAGTSGQVLTSAGIGSAPVWTTVAGPTPQYITINTQANDYTLQLSDAFNTLIRMTKATPTLLTIPNDTTANLPIGSSVLIGWNGLGQVTIDYEVGVTVDTPDTYDIGKQFGKITAIKTGANHWEIEGNLVPI